MGGSWCNQEGGGYHADLCWGAAGMAVLDGHGRGQRWGSRVFVWGAIVREPVLSRTEVGISRPRVGHMARGAGFENRNSPRYFPCYVSNSTQQPITDLLQCLILFSRDMFTL